MVLEKQLHALRYSSSLCEMDHVSCLCFSGNIAFEVMDHLIPAELYIRNNQMLHSLILDENARPLADVYLCCDEENFLLLAEGMQASELKDYINSYVPMSKQIVIDDLGLSHKILALNGPFAWEVLAELVGPEVVGLPYLTFFHFEKSICFRAGKTGEYGYDLLVPKSDFEEIKSHLLDAGTKMDLGTASLDALDLCALESWFFNIRKEGAENVTPIELQLQWRVAYQKSFTGLETLLKQKKKGPKERLTGITSNDRLDYGAKIIFEDLTIGRIVNAGYSHIRNEWIGLALVQTDWAYPGIDRYKATRDSILIPIKTISPPFLNNRSLHVNSQIHSYHNRNEYEFPPLC